METLPGPLAIGHVRYSTAGSKGQTAIRDVQPFFGEFSMGGAAIAHNGNITNANALRRELIERGSIFQSSSDSECIIHLMARSLQRNIPDRMEDALRRVEGAFSVVAMTRTKLIGVRDPLGVRPLVLGRRRRRLGAQFRDLRARHHRRRVRARDRAGRDGRDHRRQGVESQLPFRTRESRASASSSMSISRAPTPSSAAARSMRPAERSACELAREAPVEADLVCPVPDSGTPAAIGYSPGKRHPLRDGHHPQPVHGPHLHRADRADPQHGRAPEAQRQPRADPGQAGDPGRRSAWCAAPPPARSRR